MYLGTEQTFLAVGTGRTGGAFLSLDVLVKLELRDLSLLAPHLFLLLLL